jgi:CO/xanthine dehydrogenase FAD-binding subunit
MVPTGEGTSALERINRSRASYQQTTVVCANNDEDDNKAITAAALQIAFLTALPFLFGN